MSVNNTSLDNIVSKARSDIIEIAHHVDPRTGAIGTPISQAVTFATHLTGDASRLAQTYDGGPGYGVYRNETWEPLEEIMAYVEGGKDAVLTSTGRAAINVLLELLPVNSHVIVAPNDLYPGTRKRLNFLRDQGKLDVTYTDSTPEALEAALRPETRLVFTEPLTNPRMLVSDIGTVASFAKQHGILSIADNTVTPLIVRTIGDYDFDIAIHSLTKYVSGSNSAMAGALVVGKNHPGLTKEFRSIRDGIGSIAAPEVTARIVEHAKDFPDRFALQSQSALKIAHYLASHPKVAAVHHPGLPGNPGHILAARQFNGGSGNVGGLFSFELKGGTKQVEQFLNPLEGSRSISLADSFGADVTLLSWYARQSKFFAAMPDKERVEQYGITDTFLRFAVGRSDPDRLITQLERALDNVRPVQAHVPMEVAREHSLSR